MTESRGAEYYRNKLGSLREMFGADQVAVVDGGLDVDGRFLPVIDDVIVALPGSRLPKRLRSDVSVGGATQDATAEYAPEIQFTFGEEWRAHPRILPEHEAEFRDYFDLVDLEELRELRLCDLGCGIGRWSYFLAGACREVVLVDYSEAIFVARKNLADADNAIFVMADVLDLPFGNDAFDLLYCLGVLHHLPVSALDALRSIRQLARRHLVYLYYALDNRPRYFRWILGAVTRVRSQLAGVRSARVRWWITWLLALFVYMPIMGAARLLRPTGLHRFVPLADTYGGKSLARVRQDVYDRFFTGIEQRFSRKQILALSDTYTSVTISDNLPYWHFLCER